MYKAYPAIFHVAENGGYWVEFLDLPGCISEGASLAQAAAEAVDALGGYLCAMMDLQQELPASSDPHVVRADGDDIVSIVAANLANYQKRMKAIKKTLTIPEWLNDAAEKQHINFSAVLQEALIDKLS